MPSTSLRRRTLLTSTATLAAALAGCSTGLTGDDGSDDPDVPPAGVADGEHALYLANTDDTAHRVDLTVTESNAGDPVVHGTYEAPANTGAEFNPVAAQGTTYTVEATVKDGPSRSFTRETGECPPPGQDGGSRDGAVRILPDGPSLSFVVDACDALQAGTTVAFGDAGQFVVDH